MGGLHQEVGAVPVRPGQGEHVEREPVEAGGAGGAHLLFEVGAFPVALLGPDGQRPVAQQAAVPLVLAVLPARVQVVAGVVVGVGARVVQRERVRGEVVREDQLPARAAGAQGGRPGQVEGQGSGRPLAAGVPRTGGAARALAARAPAGGGRGRSGGARGGAPGARFGACGPGRADCGGGGPPGRRPARTGPRRCRRRRRRRRGGGRRPAGSAAAGPGTSGGGGANSSWMPSPALCPGCGTCTAVEPIGGFRTTVRRGAHQPAPGRAEVRSGRPRRSRSPGPRGRRGRERPSSSRR